MKQQIMIGLGLSLKIIKVKKKDSGTLKRSRINLLTKLRLLRLPIRLMVISQSNKHRMEYLFWQGKLLQSETCRVLLVLVGLLYISGIIVIFITYNNQYWILLGLILVFNSFALYFSGNYLLRCILFPYQNKFIRRQLNSGINRRFSVEFSRLIILMSKIVRILAQLDPLEGYYERIDEINNSQDAVNETEVTMMTSQNLAESTPQPFDSKSAIKEINQSK